jgi:hypothetical protein
MSAKFCQTCKKTYTDPAATFCEECGGDLVPLAAGTADTPAEEGYDEGFEDQPQPIWKKYLPMGLALAAVLVAALIIPGVIKDNIASNLKVDLNTTGLVDALRAKPPRIPLKIKNGGWLSIKIESYQIEGSFLGFPIRANSSCADAASWVKEIPSGDTWTNVDFPLCIDYDGLKASLTALPEFSQSSLRGTVIIKIFGMSVAAEVPSSAIISDENVKAAFHVKDRQIEVPPTPHDNTQRSTRNKPPQPDPPCEVKRADGTCKDGGVTTTGKSTLGKAEDKAKEIKKEIEDFRKKNLGQGQNK